jgi:NAD(P)-dependent dehydrogenase (short-subunit alcohol dehydrogenase family)
VDYRTHEGRVAVVTGAAGGIGRALCRMLATRGAQVVGADIGDLSGTRNDVEIARGQWLGVQCDVSSPEEVIELAGAVEERFGRCDVLVNNAGIFPDRHFDETDFALWRRVMSINLDGAFLTCKALVPLMQRNRWGRIVNMVSSSVENSRQALSAYKASKLGLVGLTRGIAPDVAAYGICVNAVSPAFTRTPGNMARIAQIGDRLTEMANMQCIKRLAEPEDVVPTVLFLTSDDACFITGQTIYADGGLYFK